MQLYTGDRHEILNESDREQVYDDLFEWLAGHMEIKCYNRIVIAAKASVKFD